MQNCAQNHFYCLLGNKMMLLDTFQNLNICLNICCRAILDPKNKRFGSFLWTRQNSLVISLIVFPGSSIKNGPKLKNLEKHKKSHFLIMGTSFQNALKSWIFGVKLWFFLQITYFCLYFLAIPLDFPQHFPVLL